jgi:hypothetical protein
VQVLTSLPELIKVAIYVSSGRAKQILSLLESVQLLKHDKGQNYIVTWE